MHLTPSDVLHIAQLSQLEVPENQLQKNLDQLNDIFSLIEKMRAIDTAGVEPLSHPIAAYYDNLSLRLREDQITETDHHAEYQKSAPAVENGLYLVPKVIE
ncbi:Asp-tRNA(Asn)/Glu-tRNA(Gln) amidotransferase subunit GatC [Oxalobacter vibrioformis]|uniref:Aspartyl/glutamyl-tRNA(Asn/Gln) amidotransferase subunit C n=1 Tax=Oxalobacter vibrioformis TaxID=933080 RepID=A0A9E9LWV7_9BURK|nr:Asp-tRNA(Asn)/Glu-tRNA(Gln) amidotransferase subunit GatC [Oxalobacter vibrioformis]NLC23235.1 Asp-tRNA(Asn)/Glu-tRNA(Gln) amidotransferase subunit GatC [Oxalobacter sp.]WAW10746.1 Asp-tRNA(Asn)/Glu-tRNA(Gln) amidotransferase subunit GatC [Oxalobacter vibrioformis]